MFNRLVPLRETTFLSTTTAMALALSLCCLASDELLAEEPQTEKPPKLFDSQATLDVTLTAPWKTILKNEDSEEAYPGQIRYRDSNGADVTLELTVERRGITRQEMCQFPPIRLRFAKDAAKGTAFRGQKSLKMVTHCKNSKRYDQLYVREMLIYQMYNLLTDYSFRVRPLQVTYMDSEQGKSADMRFAFLIEDDSDVAKRNGLKKLKIGRIAPQSLDPHQAGLMGLFQYMIGNTDWASVRGPEPTECCHNIKLIAPRPLGKDDYIIPLPYDFDSAGLVDAWYAAPYESLPIKSVTDRLYRGFCMHNAYLEDARQLILGQQAAILRLIDSESRLTSKSKNQATSYLEEFFEIARDPDDFNKEIIQQCRR
jgi:hypothetical protein